MSISLMNMNWKTKALMQCILSRIPFGRDLHRKLQDIVGTSRPDIEKHFRGRLEIINQMRDRGIVIEGSSFMEIGTGWHPVLPILLYLIGAERVTTLDINPWLSKQSLAETLIMLREVVNDISKSCGRNENEIRSKLQSLENANNDSTLQVTEVLEKANIHYRCPLDASDTGFRDGEFDCVISFTVLQCIPQDIITGIFAEAHRILKRNGWNVHHIFTGDPFGCDPNISTLNYLRFSDQAWYWIGGSGLAYNNRLRCADYINMLRNTGFEIKDTIIIKDEKAMEAIKSGKLKVDPKFSAYDIDELACTSLNVFAQNK